MEELIAEWRRNAATIRLVLPDHGEAAVWDHTDPRNTLDDVTSTGDEDYYCWCGTRLAYMPYMNTWVCSAHGLADRVYGPTPTAPTTPQTWNEEQIRAVMEKHHPGNEGYCTCSWGIGANSGQFFDTDHLIDMLEEETP